MSLFWRLLVVALLTVPVGAYVAGSLAAARTDLPAERPPILIDEGFLTEPATTISPNPRPDRSPSPGEGSPGGPRQEDDDVAGEVDDGVTVVRPDPDDLDDEGNRDDDRGTGDGPRGDDDGHEDPPDEPDEPEDEPDEPDEPEDEPDEPDEPDDDVDDDD